MWTYGSWTLLNYNERKNNPKQINGNIWNTIVHLLKNIIVSSDDFENLHK